MPHNIDDYPYEIGTEAENVSLQIIDSATADAALRFRVNWEDRIPFQAALLGLPSENNNPPYVGQRRPPHPYPYLPAMECREATSKPVGKVLPTRDANGMPRWEKADVFAQYGVPLRTILSPDAADPEDVPFKDFMQESRSMAAEFMNAGLGQHKWVPSPNTPLIPGEKINEEIGIVVPHTEIVFTIDNVVYVNWDVLDIKLAVLNSTVFNRCQPEELLYLGAETQRSRDISGFKPATVVLRFKRRRISWNKMYRPDAKPSFDNNTDEFYTEFWQYTDPALYQLVDFNEMFGTNNLRIQP